MKVWRKIEIGYFAALYIAAAVINPAIALKVFSVWVLVRMLAAVVKEYWFYESPEGFAAITSIGRDVEEQA